MKPEKFQAKQENMMASMLGRGCEPFFFCRVFSGPHVGEVDTAPRFCIITGPFWCWKDKRIQNNEGKKLCHSLAAGAS